MILFETKVVHLAVLDYLLLQTTEHRRSRKQTKEFSISLINCHGQVRYTCLGYIVYSDRGGIAIETGRERGY